jgi:hypothetical protein
MRMTLFHLALALFLLARGPLCGVVCDLSLFEAEVAGAAPHGAASPGACHESAGSEAPPEPAGAHDACAGCDTLLLATGESPTTGAGTGPSLQIPGIAVNGPASPLRTLRRALRIPPSIGPPPPDILLLNSTLLI